MVRLIGGPPTGPADRLGQPTGYRATAPGEPRQGLGETGSRRGADGEETGTLKAALKEARGQLLYSACSGSRLSCCQGGRVVVACSAPRNDKTISQNGRPCELKRDKARFSPCLFRRMVPNSPTSDLVRTRRLGGGTSPGSSGSGPVDQHGTKIEPTSHSLCSLSASLGVCAGRGEESYYGCSMYVTSAQTRERDRAREIEGQTRHCRVLEPTSAEPMNSFVRSRPGTGLESRVAACC